MTWPCTLTQPCHRGRSRRTRANGSPTSPTREVERLLACQVATLSPSHKLFGRALYLTAVMKHNLSSWHAIWRAHLASLLSSLAPPTSRKCSSQAPSTCPPCFNPCPDKVRAQSYAIQISTLSKCPHRKRTNTRRCAARLRTCWWRENRLAALLSSPQQSPLPWTNTTSDAQPSQKVKETVPLELQVVSLLSPYLNALE